MDCQWQRLERYFGPGWRTICFQKGTIHDIDDDQGQCTAFGRAAK